MGAIAAWAVPAAISAVSAYMGHKDNKAAQKQSQPLLDQQKEMLKTLEPYGKQFLSQGSENIGIVQNYLRSLASGDRTKTQEALAPELNSLNQRYLGASNAAREANPRGGMNTAFAQQLPYQQQGEANNLIFGARPQAMQQLGQLGTNTASLGLGALGQGAGLTNSMLDYGLNARNQSFNQASQIGSGALNSYFLFKMMQGNRDNSTAVNNSNNPFSWGATNGGGYGMFGQTKPQGGGLMGSNWGSGVQGSVGLPTNNMYQFGKST